MALSAEHESLLAAASASGDTSAVLRFIMSWLSTLDTRVGDTETAESDLDVRVGKIAGTLTTLVGTVQDDVAALTTTLTELETDVTTLEQADLPGRVAALEEGFLALKRSLQVARHYTITIPSAQRSTSTMAYQILDSDTAKVASLTFTDALGFPTADADATAAFASSDPAVFTIDATAGAITPVAPGTAQVQATVTNADGTSVTGAPADIEILAGAAVAFTVGVA